MISNFETIQHVTDTTSKSYGALTLTTNNTSVLGYKNNVLIYQDANTFSVPAAGTLVNLENENPAYNAATGFSNRITDTNYSIQAGEWTAFSPNWYQSVRVAGVEIQEANTTNTENMVMGQSTNSVLSDMLELLIDIINYLDTHTHTGVTTGGGTSGIPTSPAPNDSQVVSDKTYIDADKNLAITGTYEPR